MGSQFQFQHHPSRRTGDYLLYPHHQRHSLHCPDDLADNRSQLRSFDGTDARSIHIWSVAFTHADADAIAFAESFDLADDVANRLADNRSIACPDSNADITANPRAVDME